MNANTEERKLAAIMFTDMVGYSALSQRNEALALELLEEHRALLRPIFPKHQGAEIKTLGDGFLVQFNSALAAARCAIEIQKILFSRNASEPEERKIQLRIGIHVGDVVLREADIFGDGVNIAARIEPLAEVGGICLSGPVYDQVANKMDAPQLKNIKTPMDVYRVVLPWQEGKEKGKGQKEKFSAEVGRGIPPSRPNALTLAAVAALVLLLAGGVGWWLIHQSRQTTKQIAQSSTNSPSAATAPVTSNTPPGVAAPVVADQKSIAVLPFVNGLL
ncbi:MAG: adenylate/guanylate cyclase domain-containing protein, partial [Verrucomicrobia bacterium]|nr:adenylate/guanylate cyclase domain-containing protein [Verrucomicrobiota bacterium]